LPKADLPQRERLQGSRFSGIVRTDEYDGLAELNFDVVKALEIPQLEFSQHGLRDAV
jgi:hypothetical protein